MKKTILAALVLGAFAAGGLTVYAQDSGSASVADASPAFAQLTTNTGGTVTQPIMHSAVGDVLAVYIVRAPRQMYSKQDELFYVLSGHGTASVGYPTYPLKPGSVISIPRSTSFQIASSGSAPIKAILIASPSNDPNDKHVLEP